ncbi:MAG: hypothetical protein LBS04_01085 [Tannerellaceae bacterium]|nr:hypothetical protein [Tannerellaceae bacterium]
MKKLFVSVLTVSLIFTSCSNNNEDVLSPKKEIIYEVSIASPIDVEKLLSSSESEVEVEVPVNIVAISSKGIKTKAVVEEIIPANAVLTHRRGTAQLFFSSFYGAMLTDVYTLSITVNYGYGQWVSGHNGPDTGYAPSGSVTNKLTQKAVQKVINSSSGSWTFSTSAYYPLSNYLGQVSSACKKWYPCHSSRLKLYYTWIDGNK